MNKVLRAAILSTLALTSTAGAEELKQLRIAVVLDDAALASAVDEALAKASRIYRQQLGIELIESRREVASVAAHTHANFLLDELKAYRIKHSEHASTAATVMFTARQLKLGSKLMAGFATISPPCSAASSAIVRVQLNALEGTTLAHELAHTLNVEHDKQTGWLMSDSLNYSETFSPESLTTITSVPSDCITSATAEAPAPSPAPSTKSNGGGGAFGWQFIALLGALLLRRKP